MEGRWRMKQSVDLDVLIIGGGPAGISAGIWCKRLGLNIMILEKREELGGQLHHVYNEIIDYPGLITENGKSLAKQLLHHLNQLHIPFKTQHKVMKIKREGSHYVIQTQDSAFLSRGVILATGATERRLMIPGESEMIQRGETYSSKRDLHRLKGKRIMIVGGGDRAFEGVCNLAELADQIYLVHRSEHFRARKELVDKARQFHNVRFLTSTILEEIYGTDHVESVRLYNQVTEERSLQPMDAVLIRIGVQPADFLAPEGIKRSDDGRLYTDRNGRTNLPLFYAIGDVINHPSISSIAVCAGQGMKAAKAIIEDFEKEYEGE